jgi:hypothetical protein
MGKRVLVIVAAVVVVAFLAYVGVSSVNGSYVTAAGIAGADVTAAREGNAVVVKIRAVSGVKSASFGFTSGLIADRKSEMRVEMASTATLASVQRVVGIARAEYGHGVGTTAGAELDLTMSGAPALGVTDFSMSTAQLRSDLAAWDALRKSTGTAMSLQLADSNRRTLAFVSKDGTTYSWIASHYSLLKALSAEGFTWSSPGGCSVGSLPDEAVIAFIARLSTIIPVSPCNSSENQPGLVVAPGGAGALMPFVDLGFANGNTAQPFSAHAKQFAQVATILLGPSSPDMNIGFFGVASGKLTVLRFFTGDCTAGVITHSEKTDATSLSILKSRGVDVAKEATLGQCSPKQSVQSVTPTPGG